MEINIIKTIHIKIAMSQQKRIINKLNNLIFLIKIIRIRSKKMIINKKI